jgi:hypothetical protein
MSLDIIEKIKAFEQQEKEFLKSAANLRSEFANYISDTKIDLMTRWAFFINASDKLKNHKKYIPTFKSDGMQYIRDNFFDAPEVYGRGKTIQIKDVFEDLIYEDDNGVMIIDTENVNTSYDSAHWEDMMVGAMEEILKMNLCSFNWDW